MKLSPAQAQRLQRYLNFVLPKLRHQPTVSITENGNCVYALDASSRCIIGHGLELAQCRALDKKSYYPGVADMFGALGYAPYLREFGRIEKTDVDMLGVLQQIHDEAAGEVEIEVFYAHIIQDLFAIFGSQIDLTPHRPTSS